MAVRLDVLQRNNLHVGNSLAAEIPPTTSSRRAFVIVMPYHVDPRPKKTFLRKSFPKVLNTEREFDDDVCFACTVVEIEEVALQTYLVEAAISYSAELDLYTRSERTGLTSVEALETELCRHLDDLARLDVRWRVVPWG